MAVGDKQPTLIEQHISDGHWHYRMERGQTLIAKIRSSIYDIDAIINPASTVSALHARGLHVIAYLESRVNRELLQRC